MVFEEHRTTNRQLRNGHKISTGILRGQSVTFIFLRDSSFGWKKGRLH